jgi:hypothetical protein
MELRKEQAMSTESKPSRSPGRRITTKVILLILLFASICLYVKSAKYLPLPFREQIVGLVAKAPPISIAVRSGFLSDCVIQIYNLSDKRLMMTVNVEKSNGNRSKSPRFSIEPNGEKELGRLELGEWAPGNGDSGWIEVDGWTRVLKFSLSSDGYTHSFGLPPRD